MLRQRALLAIKLSKNNQYFKNNNDKGKTVLGLYYFASNKYVSRTCLWTKVLGTGTTYILSAQIFTQNSLRKSLKKKHSYLNLYFTTSGSDTVLLQSCIFQHIPLFYQL